MKRKFIITELAALCLALAALTGCNKNQFPSDDLSQGLDPSSGAPISFTADNAFTKAPINGIEDLETVGNIFRVWGWFQGTTSGYMFEGTEVEYKENDQHQLVWTYDPLRYWMNGTYDFAAVYPSTIEDITYKPADGSTAPSLTIPAFDVKSKDDLLVAHSNNIDGANNNNGNPVQLSFQHKLTKVNLKISQDEEDAENDYYVSRVELSGVKNKRNYTAVPVLDGNGDISSLKEAWEASDDEEVIAIEKIFNPPVRLRNPSLQNQLTELSVWPEDDMLLLIPQHIDGTTMNLRIEYTYDMTGEEDGNGYATFITKPIPATNPDDELWQSGRQITYLITLSQQTGIIFDIPTINPWSDPLTGDTVIIQ